MIYINIITSTIVTGSIAYFDWLDSDVATIICFWGMVISMQLRDIYKRIGGR